MQQIDKNEQLTLAKSLVRRAYQETANILGERLSDEENLLLDRFDNFRSQFQGQTGIDPCGQKIRYVSKSKLRKAIEVAFTNAFGSQCVKIQIDERWDPWFEMKFAGWIVATRFTFGRHQSMICYYHTIESEAKMPIQEFSSEYWPPTMRLGHWLSLGNWLGITSQTQWVSLTKEDVDQACNAVIKCSRRFFDVAPKLLKGLEFDKIVCE